MVATIYTDTHEDSQKLYDLCNISGMLNFNFIGGHEDVPEDLYGVDITVETLEDMYSFGKVSRFVFDYFKEKKDD